MRRLPLVLALALLASCTGGGPATPTGPPSPTGSPSPTGAPGPTTSPSPSPAPAFDLPPGAPTTFDRDLPPTEVPIAPLLPEGARSEGVVYLGAEGEPARIAVLWSRGEDPLARMRGLAVWAPFEDPPPWRVVYAFTDRPREQVLGIRPQTGDLTGDGREDLLTFEETGGTGACGRWRVIAQTEGGAEEILHRETCDTTIDLTGEGTLLVREAVFAPDDPHCCPSAVRLTTLAWTGARWRVVERSVGPAV
ncbi:MAG TPA: hypothetical protein VNO79_13845 [Actinomycetota bacterium]|nr:hypothetical protein [Actinomycetota bacterium]